MMAGDQMAAGHSPAPTFTLQVGVLCDPTLTGDAAAHLCSLVRGLLLSLINAASSPVLQLMQLV